MWGGSNYCTVLSGVWFDAQPEPRNVEWLRWRQITGVLCDEKMPEYLKAKIYKTFALHGAECWPTTKKMEMNAMEINMLWWSLRLTCLDHAMNEDVWRRLGVAPIIEKIREAHLRLYSHVQRSKENLLQEQPSASTQETVDHKEDQRSGGWIAPLRTCVPRTSTQRTSTTEPNGDEKAKQGTTYEWECAREWEF